MIKLDKSKTFLEKLENLDVRILYWLLVIFIAIPFIMPLGLPVPISTSTINAFQVVDSLKEGDVIMFSASTIASYPELGPSQVAIFKHCISKHTKVIMWARETGGEQLINTIIDDSKTWIENYGAEYGVDYVNMGFVPGGETAVASLATDTQNTYKADFFGTPVEQLPIMENIEGAKDFELIIFFEAAQSFLFWLRHWTSPFGVKLLICPTGMATTDIIPYYEAGQVAAYATGINGGAGWEFLLNAPGDALIGIDALSIAHLVVIVFVFLGNIIYLWRMKG